MRNIHSATDCVGSYGGTWRSGIIAEHLALFEAAGGRLHTSASGRLYGVLADGSSAPVLCAELVSIPTEDGPIDGRCGDFVDAQGFACPGHAAERDGWESMIEADRARWEREQEALS